MRFVIDSQRPKSLVNKVVTPLKNDLILKQLEKENLISAKNSRIEELSHEQTVKTLVNISEDLILIGLRSSIRNLTKEIEDIHVQLIEIESKWSESQIEGKLHKNCEKIAQADYDQEFENNIGKLLIQKCDLADVVQTHNFFQSETQVDALALELEIRSYLLLNFNRRNLGEVIGFDGEGFE